MKRRAFIKTAAVASAATALLGTGISTSQAAPAAPARSADTIRNFHSEMQYRPMGNTGELVSALGFGMLRLPMQEDRKTVDVDRSVEMIRYAIDKGVNYIDTAYRYLGGQSEMTVGKALAGGYREKVYLASKLPVANMETAGDFERFFDESRKRLQTDYLDFYLCHFVNSKCWERQILPYKVMEKMERCKQDGTIRYSGFSFHDNLVTFKKVVDANPDWNFCQIIQNYLDTELEAGLVGMQYAANRGMGVICMEPLRNGFLVKPPVEAQKVFDAAPIKRTPVQWAFDYLWNMPAPTMVLSGMSSMDQVMENLSYARRSSVGMLTLEDSMVISKAVRQYRSLPGVIPCTGCANCTCPKDVATGYLLGRIYHEYKSGGPEERARNVYNNVPAQAGKNYTACDNCETCLPKCPQGINIPQALRQMHQDLSA